MATYLPLFGTVNNRCLVSSPKTISLFLLTRSSSNIKNMSRTAADGWQSEKSRFLSMVLEEKRKIYKTEGFITLDTIEKWAQYASKNDLFSTNKPLPEDLEEFSKVKIDTGLNKVLADKISLFRGDITKLEVDAIVNAANSKLSAGGGVCGAIHRAAGPILQDECFDLNGCPTGEAKITGGYHLPAKYVIHTVGPQDKSATKLRSCYESCLGLVSENKIRSLAFPCISTGIYGFPNRLASHIALQTVRQFLEKDAEGNNLIDRIIFCTFMQVDVDSYQSLMQLYFPVN